MSNYNTGGVIPPPNGRFNRALPAISLVAKDDPEHPLTGILLGEIARDEDRPASWVVLSNDTGWHGLAACTGPVLILNKSHWRLA